MALAEGAWDPYGWTNPYTKKSPPRAGQTTVAPTAPMPSNPAGSLELSPAFTPDYKSLITNDPAYLSWQNNSQLDMAQAASARRAALRALAITYGGLPSGVQDTYGDLDPGTLQLAQQNQQSDVACLQRSHDQGVEANKRALAARNALSSGELQWTMDQADQAKAASEYDLGQQFANAFQTAINNYQGAEQQVRQNEQTAIQTAEQSAYSNPLNMPTQGATATLDPNWQAYGEPVYIGLDGSRYTADGLPWVSPTLSKGDAVPTSTPAQAQGGDPWAQGYGAPLGPNDIRMRRIAGAW